MNNFKRLWLFLWDIDPGYFRLRHAAKTILAILIALWLLRGDSLYTKLMGGIAAGISMQGIVAKSFSSRIAQVLLFDLLYFSAFSLGLAVRDSIYLTAAALIALGFSVNYGRRFGLHNSIAPMMLWLLCFLAIILPFSSTQQAWMHIEGVVIGLVVSALVMLLVFPDNYPKLFIRNSEHLLQGLAKGLRGLRNYILFPESLTTFERQAFFRLKENLNHLLDSNQMMAQSSIFIKQQKQINELLIQEYALVNAYFMMMESYRALADHGFELSQTMRRTLGLINKQFSLCFESIRIDHHYIFKAKNTHLSLQKFTEKLSRERVEEPMLIMILLNLKLAYELLYRHFCTLLREHDGN